MTNQRSGAKKEREIKIGKRQNATAKEFREGREKKKKKAMYPQISIKLTAALIARVRLSLCCAAKQTRKHVLT